MKDWAARKEAAKRADWYCRRGGRYVAGPFGPPAGSPAFATRRGYAYGQPMAMNPNALRRRR